MTNNALDGGQVIGEYLIRERVRNVFTAAIAHSAGIEGVSIDRAADLGDAVRADLATDKPILSTQRSAPIKIRAVRRVGLVWYRLQPIR